jgi:hypothetical protein
VINDTLPCKHAEDEDVMVVPAELDGASFSAGADDLSMLVGGSAPGRHPHMRAALAQEKRRLRGEIGQLPGGVGDRVDRDAAAAAAVVELVADRTLLRRREDLRDLERRPGEVTHVCLRRRVDLERPDSPIGMNSPGAGARAAAVGGREHGECAQADDLRAKAGAAGSQHLSSLLHSLGKLWPLWVLAAIVGAGKRALWIQQELRLRPAASPMSTAWTRGVQKLGRRG